MKIARRILLLGAVMLLAAGARGQDAPDAAPTPATPVKPAQQDTGLFVVDPQPGVGPKLLIRLPDGWGGRVVMPPPKREGDVDRPSDTLTVHMWAPAKGRADADLDLTFVWDAKKDVAKPEDLAATLGMMAKLYAQGAPVKQVKMDGPGIGFYAVVDNAKDSDGNTAAPGDPRCVTMGLYRVSDWVVSFRLRTPDGKAPELQQGIKFITTGINLAGQ